MTTAHDDGELVFPPGRTEPNGNRRVDADHYATSHAYLHGIAHSDPNAEPAPNRDRGGPSKR